QGEALGRFAAQLPQLKHSVALMVRREGDDQIRTLTETIGKRLIDGGWVAAREVALTETSTPDWAALLRGGDTCSVFWFAPASGLDEFYRAAVKAGSYPFFFLPGRPSGRAIFFA